MIKWMKILGNVRSQLISLSQQTLKKKQKISTISVSHLLSSTCQNVSCGDGVILSTVIQM